MNSQYKIRKGLISEELGEKTKIFDSEKSLLYSFNKSATLIFKSLKRGLLKPEIIERMVKVYKIDKKQAARDFDELIKDLKLKKIIQ